MRRLAFFGLENTYVPDFCVLWASSMPIWWMALSVSCRVQNRGLGRSVYCGHGEDEG